MTSLGCNQDHSINRAGGGPYVFKVQGHVCHKIGSLIPREGTAPLYAQLYIYDPQEALDFRMNYQANAGLNKTVMNVLQDMLYRHHPAVQLYKQTFELTKNMGPEQQCKIALRFDENTDHRRYNLPTATSHEIAVIIPGDGDQPDLGGEIVLHRLGGGLKGISERHPLYPSLHYVLLFPTGQLGWHPNIPYGKNQNQANQNEANQNEGNAANVPHGGEENEANKNEGNADDIPHEEEENQADENGENAGRKKCFYLCTLLFSVKGATLFEDLHKFNGVLYPTFHAACLAHGLLEDEN